MEEVRDTGIETVEVTRSEDLGVTPIAENAVVSESEVSVDEIKHEKTESPVRAPKVVEASKRKKRQLYASDKVFKLDKDSTDIDEVSEQKKAAFIELVASVKNGRILTGTVVGCHSTADNDIVAEVMFEPYTVIIPSKEFLIYPKDADPAEILPWIKTQMNHRLGSEVDFLVKYANEGQKLFLASRLDAMYAKAHDHYGKDHAGKAKIETGQLAEARIVSVEGIGVTVEIFGAECFIKQDEISWNRMAEVDKEYDVGDVVNVSIMDIIPERIEKDVYDITSQTKKKRTLIRYNVQASIKRAGKDPRDEYYNDFAIGGNYLAEVTQINTKGVYVRMAGKMDALCGLPDKNQVPTKGSRVMVTVTDKKDDIKLIYATIKKVIKLA